MFFLFPRLKLSSWVFVRQCLYSKTTGDIESTLYLSYILVGVRSDEPYFLPFSFQCGIVAKTDWIFWNITILIILRHFFSKCFFFRSISASVDFEAFEVNICPGPNPVFLFGTCWCQKLWLLISKYDFACCLYFFPSVFFRIPLIQCWIRKLGHCFSSMTSSRLLFFAESFFWVFQKFKKRIHVFKRFQKLILSLKIYLQTK